MTDQEKDPQDKAGEEKLENEFLEKDGKNEIKRFDPEALSTEGSEERMEDDAIYVDDMYGDWFLDYASYVILERAGPHADDGLKPV